MTKLILIMILVVAVAWGALAFGVSGGSGNMARATKGAEAWFGGMMTSQLSPGDLVARNGCTRQGAEIRLNADRNCQLIVQAGGFRVRRAALSAVSGTGKIRFRPAPSDDPRPDPAAAKAPPVTLSVHSEGGIIDLECNPGSHCRFRLGAAP